MDLPPFDRNGSAQGTLKICCEILGLPTAQTRASAALDVANALEGHVGASLEGQIKDTMDITSAGMNNFAALAIVLEKLDIFIKILDATAKVHVFVPFRVL